MEPTKETVQVLIDELKQETAAEVIKIKVKPDTKVELTSSKFGGLFYLPKTADIPTNSEGKQLFLLAQINCEELPENTLYPKKGILQFWIMGDDMLGMDCDSLLSDENKRVLYYPDIEEHFDEEELERMISADIDEDYSPLAKGVPFALKFKKDSGYLELSDYRFDDLLIKKWNDRFTSHKIGSFWDISEVCDDGEEFADKIYDEMCNECNTKIGGYGYFTQTDPRSYFEDLNDYSICLLQIDSDWNDRYEIMWGDAGVGAFYTTKEKLAKLDFTACLYNWDCS